MMIRVFTCVNILSMTLNCSFVYTTECRFISMNDSDGGNYRNVFLSSSATSLANDLKKLLCNVLENVEVYDDPHVLKKFLAWERIQKEFKFQA